MKPEWGQFHIWKSGMIEIQSNRNSNLIKWNISTELGKKNRLTKVIIKNWKYQSRNLLGKNKFSLNC
jgi:hypothetical protein